MERRARAAPITDRSGVPAEFQAIADAVIQFYGEIRGPWGMLLHSPALAGRVLPMVPFFHEQSIVDRKLRSAGILAAVREYAAPYVWAAQVAAARRNGVREELIAVLRAKGSPAQLPPEEREIVLYARQLARDHRVEETVFRALERRHGVKWLVELTACLGYFSLVSGIANAFDIPAQPGGDLFKAEGGRRKSKVERGSRKPKARAKRPGGGRGPKPQSKNRRKRRWSPQ